MYVHQNIIIVTTVIILFKNEKLNNRIVNNCIMFKY